MKKIYLLALALFAFTFVNAQIIDDNFDFYTLGDMGNQAPGIWGNWSQDPVGSPTENIIVSDDFASSGTQSGMIGPGQGPQDALLYLGNQTTGDYTLRWNMYIPSGNEGYFNLQGEIPASGALSGVWNTGDIYFNQDNGAPGVGTDTAVPGDDFTFPHDEWFDLAIYVDLDAGPATYELFVNGVAAYDNPVPFQTDNFLGAVDFFAASPSTTYYVDDVYYDTGNLVLGNGDFTENAFSVYPNPVQDILNIHSVSTVESVVVYDVLGKVVLQVQPNSISPSIDMSALSSGAYMVQVTVGNATKTVKVIK
jgi:hypothetical protein